MKLHLERRAEIAFRSLRGADQRQVGRALDDLTALEAKAIFRNHKVHKVLAPTGDSLYICRGGMRLRLVLDIKGEDCKVIDIVDHDRLGRLLLDRGQR